MPSLTAMLSNLDYRGPDTSPSTAPTGSNSSNSILRRHLSLDMADNPPRYERDTGANLAEQLDGTPDAASADSLSSFIEERAARFTQFRADGHARARKWLKPIAATVQLLSSSFGDAVTLPFSPMKAVFGAIDVAIKMSIEVTKDYDAAMDAFETIANHLARIKIVGANSTLREPSVRVLSQTLIVLGIITQLQRDGRFKTWLHKFKQSHELVEALADLQRLAANHHETLSAVTLFSVEKTMDILGDSMTAIQQEQDMTRACLTRIAKVAQEIHEDEEVERIFIWLRYPDSSSKINNLLLQRARSTGSWFLDGEAFSRFKAGTTRVLWLRGKAGSGKSTMIAAASRDLRAFCNTTGCSLAFLHVFDTTNNAAKRNLCALLGSVLCQFAHHIPDIAVILSQARREHMRGHVEPSLNELKHYLKLALDRSPHVFLMIDALDEVDDPGVIPFLCQLKARHKVSILVSSRSENVSRAQLENLADERVDIFEDIAAKDIGILLDQVFERDGLLADIRDVHRVRDALESGANGNFRWVSLQTHELASVAGIPRKLYERLASMPLDLRAIYDEALQKIRLDDQHDIRRLLMWLLFGARLPSKRELMEIMAFDYSQPIPVFDVNLRPSSVDYVLALVGSTFLTVDPDTDDVCFAHASVREYLLALPSSSPFHCDPSDAMYLLTASCVSYLRLGAPTDAVGPFSLMREGSMPLYAHASQQWLHYAAAVDPVDFRDLVEFVVDYLNSPAHVEAHGRQLRFLSFGEPGYDNVIYDSMQPLYVACEALIPGLVECVLARIHPDPNRWQPEAIHPMLGRKSPEWVTRSPLMVAISAGRDEMAAPDTEARRLAVIAQLLSAGANVNAFIRGRTPLHYAVATGDAAVTRTLLEAGANVNVRTYGRLRELPESGTPEYYATRSVSWPIHIFTTPRSVRLSPFIVRIFAWLTAESRYIVEQVARSALHRAVRRGDAKLVKLLLRFGASPNALDDSGATPLHEAADRGNEEILKILLTTSPAHWRRYGGLSRSLRLEYAEAAPAGSRTRAWGRGRSLSFPAMEGTYNPLMWLSPLRLA
ncbi:hypothetical protein GGG16DRAFT_110665 [Schizophyllum commune]